MLGFDEKKFATSLVDAAATKLVPLLQPMADKAVSDLVNGLIGRKFTFEGVIPGRTFTIKIE